MMCKCFKCDNLVDDEPIKVIDFASTSPFSNDEIYHWETAYKCTYNGSTEINVEDLAKNGCRCIGSDWFMGIYSPYEVYPSWYDDEIDLSKCDDCDFDCWTYQYCKYNKKDWLFFFNQLVILFYIFLLLLFELADLIQKLSI